MMESLTKHPYSAISGHSTVKGTPTDIGEWLTSCRRDSPVNPSVSPENNERETTSATCGPPPSTPFAEYCQSISFWRTFQDCLPGVMDISDKYSESWPKQGMMRNGCVYHAPTVVAPINGNGYGYWPTPQAHDAQKGNPDRVGRFGTKHGGRNLNDAAARWASPSVRDYKGAVKDATTLADGTDRTNDQLPNQVEHLANWATPNATDGEKGGPNQRGSKGDLKLPAQAAQWDTPTVAAANKQTPRTQNGRTIIGSIRGPMVKSSPVHTGKRGQLNPEFVSWLMGIPEGWTKLKALEMDKFQSWRQQHSGFFGNGSME